MASTSSELSSSSVLHVKTFTSRISWEFPGLQGIGCNMISNQDTPNFLSFLLELRAHPIGRTLILTAAAPNSPWPDPNGNPSDISPFAKLLDHVTLMNYDVWGSWSPAVGPNAPLNDTCAPPQYQQSSGVSAVRAWTNAGLPKNQLVLGVPSYGHSFLVDPSVALTAQGDITAYPQFKPEQPRGDSSDDEPGVDVCGAQTGQGGVFNFWGLVEGGFLDKRGKPIQGIHYRYDECSQTVRSVNNRCSLTSGLMQNIRSISPTFTTPPHKSWFRLMTRNPLEPRENSSKTLVCEDMRCGKLLGTIGIF